MGPVSRRRARAASAGLLRPALPNVRPDDPVRVERVASYPGLLGLWHIALRFPDIVEPPGTTVP